VVFGPVPRAGHPPRHHHHGRGPEPERPALRLRQLAGGDPGPGQRALRDGAADRAEVVSAHALTITTPSKPGIGVDRVEQIAAAGTGGSSTPPPVRRRSRRPVLVVAGVVAALVLVTVGGILWAGLAPDAAKPAASWVSCHPGLMTVRIRR